MEEQTLQRGGAYFCPVPDIIAMITPTRVRLVGHAARMRKIRNASQFWFKSLKRKVHSEDLDVHGRIILKQIFLKNDVKGSG